MQKATIIKTIIVATLAFAAVDALADDEIYRWVDENGTVHFDKQPPANSDAKQVDLQLHQAGVVPSDPTPDQQAEPQVSYAQQQRDERAKNREENIQKQEISDTACAQPAPERLYLR